MSLLLSSFFFLRMLTNSSVFRCKIVRIYGIKSINCFSDFLCFNAVFTSVFTLNMSTSKYTHEIIELFWYASVRFSNCPWSARRIIIFFQGGGQPPWMTPYDPCISRIHWRGRGKRLRFGSPCDYQATSLKKKGFLTILAKLDIIRFQDRYRWIETQKLDFILITERGH